MLNFVRAWVWLSALLIGAGWTLSAMHQLNRCGYLAVFLLALAVPGWRRRKLRLSWQDVLRRVRRTGQQLARRCRRPAPLLFLALALVALVGGALYVPTNIDTNAYRIPRVLHWLGQEQWHWIHTYDPRLNSAGCGFEWLSAPLILFTRTDRFLFLINWLSYLMLPGLIFSVFVRLGVRSRVAWWWMWFLPSGWIFAMQAGSTGNDSLGAIYALAAVDLVLRAVKNRSVGDLWLSLLAAALLTGLKPTSLPLFLPWLIAAGGGLKLLRARPLVSALVVAASLLVSIVPVIIANLVYCGNWMGFSRNMSGLQNPLWIHSKFEGSPFWGVVGNIFCITVQNLAPPYFPLAERWNAAMDHFVHTAFGAHFASFDQFCLLSRFTPELSSLGPGLCLFAVVSMWAVFKYRRSTFAAEPADRFRQALRLAPWGALLVFMAKTASFAGTRYLAPYYPLLFPLLLAQPGQACLVRQRWWQWLGLSLMAFTALLLVVSQDRPLFPARMILGRLQLDAPHSRLVSSILKFYSIDSRSYGNERSPFEKDLPENEICIGYTSDGGQSEPGLWLPFGCRKVEQVRAEDTRQRLQQLGVHYVVVDDIMLSLVNETIEQWMKRYNAELIDEAAFKLQPSQPLMHGYLVRLP